MSSPLLFMESPYFRHILEGNPSNISDTTYKYSSTDSAAYFRRLTLVPRGLRLGVGVAAHTEGPGTPAVIRAAGDVVGEEVHHDDLPRIGAADVIITVNLAQPDQNIEYKRSF